MEENDSRNVASVCPLGQMPRELETDMKFREKINILYPLSGLFFKKIVRVE